MQVRAMSVPESRRIWKNRFPRESSQQIFEMPCYCPDCIQIDSFIVPPPSGAEKGTLALPLCSGSSSRGALVQLELQSPDSSDGTGSKLAGLRSACGLTVDHPPFLIGYSHKTSASSSASNEMLRLLGLAVVAATWSTAGIARSRSGGC